MALVRLVRVPAHLPGGRPSCIFAPGLHRIRSLAVVQQAMMFHRRLTMSRPGCQLLVRGFSAV